MPSPFPGMDPYLEAPGIWPDVHHELISAIRAVLNPRLRPNYYASVEERVYIEGPDDPGRSVRVPDVVIVGTPGNQRQVEAGNVAVAEPIETATWFEEEVHESYLEIHDRESRLTVAVIEVLSPSNKVAGSAGMASYESKRREVMQSRCHWIEIDLHRGGVPVTSALSKHQHPHEYLVHVSRGDRRPLGSLYPIRLSERLPVVPIPLKPEHADLPLDLQDVLATAYDRASYDLRVDCRAEPVPPLEGEWTAWSDRLLREQGLRSG